ncbi:MAG: 16S rRNA (cytosine(1402)-N(4))-methyltransferase RsmH [Candidatus Magasanikbacteria bacterium]|uniref:Ribosomal RNA small subunit methyltransferase H n=1 Tax=Candidatus Magasanikbacteria bacterium CG10_big_fil_rev_8_21_14_0_10_38_6 TaxID=1974647 RepID=A0A2M6P1Y3_9BACT|nr:16S rRNA (cytosine(1402)-N(4))-methyltransferase RsmH [Candidatus Magasanikbacteria bacterium]NCS72138.1 16S rRNA (cytosine(1402)-N(4))-methyltransferase RsmH [Candidatus Magasanikbacteria bacterium]PIR77559.1 MAG: 16S rRNA (cytosine(1402)-N(4))-methyltransferase [Candidatus Magasanikbacteria bacterium CG10_big_fil_rev_8_21_14_0_10_38_6]
MSRHEPVLLAEVIENVSLTSGMTVIDCTVGDGGHSEKLVQAIGNKGTLLAIDADPESLLRAKKYLHEYKDNIRFVRGNFEHLKEIAEKEHIDSANVILMDFGWSSPQFSDRNRGFSFQGEEPLDMRYGAGLDHNITAKEIVNQWSAEELEKIFKEYGEEKQATKIAHAITEARKDKEIETTKDLVDIILTVFRDKFQTKKDLPWVGGLHPATKIFQALRIAVNDELGVIERVLPQAIELLAPGGRLAIITFHSLEDRIVKHYFKKRQEEIAIITKKPIVPTDEEAKQNSRSRSAKLRVIEKK